MSVPILVQKGGEPVNLTRAFDRDENNPVWSPDGKVISL
jgi:hypothetical protein